MPPVLEHHQFVAKVLSCDACRLRLSRTHPAICRGPQSAPLMILGEAPGVEDDQRGLPFVGPSGLLLSHALLHAEIPEDQVYICNLVKCKPPRHQMPTKEEIRSCHPWLLHQIITVQPRAIVTVGRTATATLTGQRKVWAEDEVLVCSFDERTPVYPIWGAERPNHRVDVEQLRRAWREATT